MERPVTINLAMATDASTLTLTISDIDGPPLAHATLNAQQLRQLVVNLVQALAHLEGEIPPEDTETGKRRHRRPAVAKPAWHLEQLKTGEPVILIEMFPRLWTSFSLSVPDGRKLSALLEEKLGCSPARRPTRASRTARRKTE